MKYVLADEEEVSAGHSGRNTRGRQHERGRSAIL